MSRGVAEEPVGNALDDQHQKLHDERENIRTGGFKQLILAGFAVEALRVMLGYVDSGSVETGRDLVRPVPLGHENERLVDERIEPARQIGRLRVQMQIA